MSDLPALEALLARVEVATGADREMDLDLARALAPNVICLRQRIDPVTGERKSGDNEEFVHWKYTASLDAAIALCERVLPGWGWAVGWPLHNVGAWASVWREGFSIDESGHAWRAVDGRVGLQPDAREMAKKYAPTPALALLAAILRAKIAEMTP